MKSIQIDEIGNTGQPLGRQRFYTHHALFLSCGEQEQNWAMAFRGMLGDGQQNSNGSAIVSTKRAAAIGAEPTVLFYGLNRVQSGAVI